eukprot:scaffold40854_cov34-Tisochrysis_lutea.AAC.5
MFRAVVRRLDQRPRLTAEARREVSVGSPYLRGESPWREERRAVSCCVVVLWPSPPHTTRRAALRCAPTCVCTTVRRSSRATAWCRRACQVHIRPTQASPVCCVDPTHMLPASRSAR